MTPYELKYPYIFPKESFKEIDWCVSAELLHKYRLQGFSDCHLGFKYREINIVVLANKLEETLVNYRYKQYKKP